jgi:ATP-dependent Clp protease adaptor protein ClpS
MRHFVHHLGLSTTEPFARGLRSPKREADFRGAPVLKRRSGASASSKAVAFKYLIHDRRLICPPGENKSMAERKQGGQSNGAGSSVVTEVKPKTQKPSLYRVLILNDDYTPMEFVVYVLERFFNKSREDATRIMLHVHQNGVGVCGVYTYEVAETKVAQVIDSARRHQHPLQCTMEKD